MAIMDYKVALVVLMAAVALTSAAPGTVLFYRDFFQPQVASTNTFSAGAQPAALGAQPTGAGAQPAAARAESATAGAQFAAAGAQPAAAGAQSAAVGAQFTGAGAQLAARAGNGAAQATTGGFNSFFNPSLFHLYNEDFEFDIEDFGLFRGVGAGHFFDYEPEEGYFPYF